MNLSQWPEKFENDPTEGPKGKLVEVTFEEEAEVVVKTKKTIGLQYEDCDEVDIWLPISQIDGDIPDVGDFIETITIPEWLADEKGL